MTAEPRIVTFGCRLNTYESEVMRSHARTAGLDDAIIFNTCAVTAEAERQARQAIRKARRDNPGARIIVTGCAAQVDPERFAAMEEVDFVIGNDLKLKSETWGSLNGPPPPAPSREGELEGEGVVRLADSSASFAIPPPFITPPTAWAGGKIWVNDIMAVRETAGHLIDGIEGQARAFLQVQNGCDHRCTFCIIPFGRGPSRSVPIGVIAEQVKNLVESGYNEIVFTGVDITSYGPDLPGAPTLGQMIRRVLARVPGLKRLRLSSLDPVEIDEDLWRLIAEEPRLMPHLHLSLQAGDDMVLKRMKRRHLRADAIAMCERARAYRPDMAFGADIIAGFPTEDGAMFQNTLDIVEECDLTFLHVFPYSERPGTPAARMPSVPKPVRKERAATLRAAGERQVEKFLNRHLNKHREVIVEKGNIGRTEHFAGVRIDRDVTPGALLSVHTTGIDGGYLTGTVVA